MSASSSSEHVQAQLTAAKKEAFQQAQLINVFKTVLLVAVLVALCGGVAYFVSKQANPAVASAAHPTADRETQHRIIALEEQLQHLKADVTPAREMNPVMEAAAAVAKFAIDNWVLLSFVVAVATAIYVKFHFGIDYFESYRDVATKKMLSEFYRKLGDRMMVYGEWEPAEAAYRNSLEINPTNKQASFGVAKAGLFQPLKGQKFYAPDMVEAKLDFLIANVPGDAQLVFLKGFNRFLQGDNDESIRLLRQAIAIDPQFVGSYIQLGYMLMGAGEIEPAIGNFKKALEIDASYSLTNNNLGYCYLITLQRQEAVKCFELSLKICPTLLNTISLADAYRLNGNLDDAHRLHAHAVRVLGEKDIEKERYIGGQWLYNFMPLKEGDRQTIQQAVQMYSFEQKKMVTLAALAFDQALRGETIQADKAFAQSMALDKAGEFHGFFANKIQSLLNLVKMSPGAHTWFEGKLRELTAPVTGPAG